MRAYPFLVLAASVSAVSAARAQDDRLGRFEPGLIVETGARMGACDVLTFTADGKYLLACGDDKVVRIWKFNGTGLDTIPVQTLRWSIFREQRGSIYAMALSPHEDNRYVAIGGVGVRVGAGSVGVLDRKSGEVAHIMKNTQDSYAIWSLGFSPSGERIAYGKGDGSVGIWDWQKDKAGAGRRLGKHNEKNALNAVRLVAFLDEHHLLSVAESGDVLQWDLGRPDAAPTELFRFDGGKLFRVTISRDKKWLAGCRHARLNPVEVWSVDGRTQKKIKLGGDDVPHSVAFDAKAERLAIGAWTSPLPKGNDFFKETGGKVLVYDLKPAQPRALSGPKLTFTAEAVAFHPDGKHLAAAGGDDHDVTLWDLQNLSSGAVTRIRSPGSCLWSVALSKDSRTLGFRDQRATEPTNPNVRGKGLWRTFDLQQRRWAGSNASFEPVQPLETQDGWSVRFDQFDSHVWYAVAPSKKEFKLPLERAFYALPRCYTFLAKRGDKPARLAVGHYWGVSLFDLTSDGPKLARLMIGHQGEVMALGVSADQRMLVSASRDQTIAAWSLVDWPTQPELGARFLLRQDKIAVDEVEAGSPAWEAGLTKGDEVLVFSFHPAELYDPGKRVPAAKRAKYKLLTSDACMERLRRPEPGQEFYFQVQREGKREPVELATLTKQRPLWRFFPTRGGEWVLWRWRDYYYDSSTNGDSLIGWHVNDKADKTPAFYRAEQFRRHFYQPDKVKAMLAGIHAPERVSFPDLEPPDVKLAALATEINDQDLKVTLRATARGDHANHKLEKVLLWINDYQFRTWAPANGSFEQELVIPRGKLRRGVNLLTLQCYNRSGGRGEATPLTVTYTQPEVPPKLYGVIVGVGDYSKSALRLSKSKLQLADLNADKDAEAMHRIWSEQKGKLYKEVDVELLVNQKATPAVIMQRLRALADKVRPDDRLVLFFGSHGTSAEVLQELVKLDGAKVVDELNPRSFAVLGPLFDHARPNKTCITSLDLYEAIAHLPCHKLVLLDACHSGSIAVNPVRELTRDGVGPVIVAACSPKESALELGVLDANRAYGLFTMAVRRALEEEFDDVDKDRDRMIDSVELAAFVRARVPQLVAELKRNQVAGIKASDTQTPTAFLPRLERGLPWAKK